MKEKQEQNDNAKQNRNNREIDNGRICMYTVNTQCFEWDSEKNELNKTKHGISFEEAATVFFDDYYIYIKDWHHSDIEERFIAIGMSIDSNILLVCHCLREEEQIIRIISARKADKHEEEFYNAKYREQFIF